MRLMSAFLVFTFTIPVVKGVYFRGITVIASNNSKCMNVTFNCAVAGNISLINIDSVNLTCVTRPQLNVTACVPFTNQFVQCIKWKLDRGEYVVDENKTLIYTAAELKYVLGEFNIRQDGSAVVCVPDEQRPIVYYIDLVTISQYVLSTVSLMLAILIESIIQVKNQCCRLFISHLVSLLVFYLCRIILSINNNANRQFCFFLSYGYRYMFRVAFAWITVINFEIWNQTRPSNFFKQKTRTSRCKKYFYQSLFAWTVPCVIVCVTYILEFAKPIPSREEACTYPLIKNNVQTIFLYSATGVILVVNMLLFILTSINFYRIGKNVLVVNKNVHKQLCKFYFKLMALTGIYWFMEIPVWASMHTISRIFSAIVDSIAFLHGFFLFLLVYGCRKSLGREIKRNKETRRRKISKSIGLSNLSSASLSII